MEQFAQPNDWEKLPEKPTKQEVLGAIINNNNAGLMWEHRAKSCEAWVKDVEELYESNN